MLDYKFVLAYMVAKNHLINSTVFIKCTPEISADIRLSPNWIENLGSPLIIFFSSVTT